MGYKATIVADSINQSGDRLTTMEVTFPRPVLSEFNTHRTFSRNSASSRAIPVHKQMERIMNDPFVPIHWGKNQSGMQAYSEIDVVHQETATSEWLAARDSALQHAQNLLSLGIHKQIVNRVLEPFMWHTVIVTATEWSNFFALRDNEMAQPEIHKIARMMRELYDSSTPKVLHEGEWHMPLIQPEEASEVAANPEKMRKVSAARCARVSYLTHDGRRDLEADLALYERLVSSGHMSPLEHVATPAIDNGQGVWFGNFRGWKQLRKFIPNEDDFAKVMGKE